MTTARVLLVASKTGYQTRAFDAAASRLGIALMLATDRCHMLEDPWRDRALPVRFDQPEAAPAAIPPGSRFDGIIAVGDRPACTAAHIAARHGLRYHSPAGAGAATDKFAARERFAAAGLLVPRYERLPLGEDPRQAAARARAYPCVLKPLGLSASRGVIRADEPTGFASAFERIRRLLNEPEIRERLNPADRYIQVEDYIPGREFAVEGLMRDGRLQPLAIFDKPDPLEGPFFAETIYVTPSRESPAGQAALIETAQQAAAALGLSDGPVHAELRLNEAGIWPLEIAPRPIGGLCSRALRFGPDGSLTLEELILRHAIGEDTSAWRRVEEASGVFMIPVEDKAAGFYRGVEGVEAARGEPLVTGVEITARPGQPFRPLPEGSSYLGFIFASGPDPASVEQALRRAQARLRFSFNALLPVARASTL